MSRDLPHICLVCSSLNMPGGIERATVNTANLLSEKGYAVSLLITDDTTASFYPIHSAVQLIKQPLDFGIINTGNVISRKLRFFKHIAVLRKQFSVIRPDVILGTEYALSIASYYAAKKTGTKIFAWEHHHFHWLDRSRFWKVLFKNVYPKLKAVICLNKTEAALFEKAGCSVAIIPNFVVPHEPIGLEAKNILSIGWLIKRKGFLLTPPIAERVFLKHPDWTWTIIGAGEQKAQLQEEINRRGLKGKVIIIAPQSHQLDEAYRSASIYVMTSKFECFPMVLLEAMSYGLPCISFDCPTGPSFIISDGEDGFLIKQNDADAMAEAINNLIADEATRKDFGSKAHGNAARFSPDKIGQLWQQLLSPQSNKNL